MACPLACKSAESQSQTARAFLKPCSEGQESLMLRDGGAPVLASHLPAVSQPATVDTPCQGFQRAVGSGGDLMASGLWSLALLRSSQPKGHLAAGHRCRRNGSCACKGRGLLWQDGS